MLRNTKNKYEKLHQKYRKQINKYSLKQEISSKKKVTKNIYILKKKHFTDVLPNITLQKYYYLSFVILGKDS